MFVMQGGRRGSEGANVPVYVHTAARQGGTHDVECGQGEGQGLSTG